MTRAWGNSSLEASIRTGSRTAVRLLYRARTALLIILLLASSAAALWFADAVLDARTSNRAIDALSRNEDIAVDALEADGELLLARLAHLLRQDRRDEAQSLVDMSRRGRATRAQRAKLFTLLANARIRRAMDLIEKGRQDDAIPEVRLAKEAYRQALRQDPASWDAKHNFDVAMRLVRDLPEGEGEAEDVPPDAPKRLWTDLPGVPRGLP